METVVDTKMPAGSFDSYEMVAADWQAQHLRRTAVRVACLKYKLLGGGSANLCGCGKCAGQTVTTDSYETEP